MLNMRFDSSWGLKLQQAYTGTGNIQYNFINRYNAVDYNSLTFKGLFVGIGTTNPRSIFHLHRTATAQDVRIILTDGTTTASESRGFHLVKTPDNNAYVWNLENTPLIFGTNGTERMRILSNGTITMSSSLSLGGGLTIPPDTIAITSGGGGRTYYINNGPSLYWGYGTANNHEFRNSANTTMFAISNAGSLAMKENVWHNDVVGYNRFYFGNNSTTYISGHGTDSCVEFRQNTNSMTARITNIGQWACHFRTIANSNTDDIGVNSNTSLDAVGYYFAHIIYNTFTGFHRCYYADDEIFNNDSSKEETDIFKNNRF